MQKVMEVYDLREACEPQMKQRRCWALKPQRPGLTGKENAGKEAVDYFITQLRRPGLNTPRIDDTPCDDRIAGIDLNHPGG